MPIDVDLTGCCKECFMPLHGGICEFDPEHTPFPEDLGDPDLADWFPKWAQNYQRKDLWPFAFFGPCPPVPEQVGQDLSAAPAMGLPVRSLPEVTLRHPGAPIWGDRALCPECLMPVMRNWCALSVDHDVSVPVWRDAEDCWARGARVDGCSLSPASRAPPAPAAPPSAVEGDARVDARGCLSWAQARLPTSIEAWLREMDDLGFLAPYHDAIAGHFDSPAQVVDLYARPGLHGRATLDPKFLTEMGIMKVGHRRLFEKWFSERIEVPRTGG